MEGWIKLYRRITEHPDYFSEPFTRMGAWIDLILLANHKPNSTRFRGVKVEVGRGQTAVSQENLARRWGWSRGKAKRFLDELETGQQIVQQKNNVSTIISIVNYDRYQQVDTADDTANDPQIVQQTIQQTDTNKNDKKKRNINTSDFDQFWDAYHQVTGRKKEERLAALNHWKKMTAEEKRKAIEMIGPYARSLTDHRFCKLARTYLSGKTFENEFTQTGIFENRIAR